MMVTAVVAAVVAVACHYLTPRVLSDMGWQVRRPRLALTAWFGALLFGCCCAFLALSSLVAASLAVPHDASISVGLLRTFAGWLGLMMLGVVVALVLVAVESLVKSYRAVVDQVAPVSVTQQHRDGFTLTRFQAPQPLAYTLGGKRAEILLSSGLEALLPRPQVQAVLAHEYAHLRQRHGAAIRVAEIHALCLPARSRAGCDFRRATLLLVELAADDAAARQAGAVHLARALYAVAEATGDAGLRLRVLRLMQRSWPLARRCTVPEPIRL